MTMSNQEAIVQVMKIAMDQHDWRLVRQLTRLIEALLIDEDTDNPPFMERQS